eukprot:scaffold7446_cov403-Prasinococcus_capsulatus_cf.AAC.3
MPSTNTTQFLQGTSETQSVPYLLGNILRSSCTCSVVYDYLAAGATESKSNSTPDATRCAGYKAHWGVLSYRCHRAHSGTSNGPPGRSICLALAAQCRARRGRGAAEARPASGLAAKLTAPKAAHRYAPRSS